MFSKLDLQKLKTFFFGFLTSGRFFVKEYLILE